MRYIFFVLFTILSLAACRDDFSLEAPYRDIPVVFAYLNDAEDTHYVRVQRAFFGLNGNAELAAQLQDSLYYLPEAATVSLQQGEQTIILDRVNGDDFGIERPEGTFANSPNILYRFTNSDLNLQPNASISLRVERPGEEDALATTRTLGEIDIVQPNPNTPNIVLENYRQFQNWRWNVSSDARVFDARLRITVREFFPNDPSQNRDRVLEWVINDKIIPDPGESRVVLQFRNELFWQFLGNELEENPDVRRIIGRIDMVVTGVGGEVEELLALQNANTGITSAQALPTYSNVENGLGIFTSRTQRTLEGISLDPRNLDTLRNGIYTRNLNFQ